MRWFSVVLFSSMVAVSAIAPARAQAPAPVQVQAQPLPAGISGRWTFRNRSDAFSLESVTTSADSAFAARLTWWTTDKACVVRGEPITGRVSPAGISFEAKTRCDVAFVVELNRTTATEWVGEGTIKGSNPPVLVQLKARSD